MTELQNLITGVINKDEEAIRELYNLTYKKAYIEALSFMGTADKAEDVLQIAYINIFNKIDTLSNPNGLFSWINTIVANTCKTELKKNNAFSFSDLESYNEDNERSIDIEDESIEFIPNKSIEYDEDRKIVLGFIEELPTDQKSALVLQVYHDMKISEIAEIFECSEGTIKSRLNYAKRTLKEKITEYRRKGNRLFVIPFIPYLKYIFAGLEESVEIDLVLFNKISSTVASSSIATTIAEKTAESIVKTATKKTVAQKATKIVASKVVKGVLSASLIAGGTFGIYKGYETYNEYKNPIQDSNTNIVDQDSSENNSIISPEEYLEKVKDIFQNDYLNNKDIKNAPKKIFDLYNEAVTYYPNNSIIEECRNYFIEEEAAYYRFYLVDHLEIHGNSYIYADLNNDGQKELVVIDRREDENVFYQQNNSRDILNDLPSLKRDSFTLLTIDSNKNINQIMSYGDEYLSDISFLGFKDNQICITRKQADLIVDDTNNMNYLDFYVVCDIYSYNSSNANLVKQEKELIGIYEGVDGVLNDYQTYSDSFKEYDEITFNEIK